MTTIEISKEAFKAHNQKAKGAVANENYNKMYKLGSSKDRQILRHIQTSKYGICGSEYKLSVKDVNEYINYYGESHHHKLVTKKSNGEY